MAQIAAELHIEDVHQPETQTSAESRIQSSPVLGLSPPGARASAPVQYGDPGEASQHAEIAIPSPATTASAIKQHSGHGDVHHAKDVANRQHQIIDLTLEETDGSQSTATQPRRGFQLKRNFESFAESVESMDRTGSHGETTHEDHSHLVDSQESSVSARALETRRTAFNSVLHESNPARWAGLLSTTNNHTHRERELGDE